MLNWLSWSGLWLVFSAFCLLWSRFGASLASVSAVIIPPLSSLWPLRSVALGFALCRFLVRFRRYGVEFFFKSSLGVEFVNELLGSALCRLHVRHNLLICKLVLFDTECPDGGYILLLFGGEGCSPP